MLPGLLGYPVHTRLIPAQMGLKIPKGRGECSMSGVRRRGDKAIVVHQRQCKTCMVKAKLPEPQSTRLTVWRRRRIAETSYREEYGPW